MIEMGKISRPISNRRVAQTTKSSYSCRVSGFDHFAKTFLTRPALRHIKGHPTQSLEAFPLDRPTQATGSRSHMLSVSLSSLTLLSAGASFRLAVRPPPKLSQTERAKDTDISPIYIEIFRRAILLYQGIIYLTSLVETTAFLLSVQSQSPTIGQSINQRLLDICPTGTSSLRDILYPGGQLPPLALFSCLLMTSGALFRAWSQDSLGQWFTWEPAIRPGHKLYTAGPYSLVRHPSYTGADLLYAGHILFGFARHTFLSECVASKYPVSYAGLCTFMVVWVVIGVLNMQKRAVMEDRLLKREFGKEWEDWARRTRFRLFPGIW